jgi:WhiB family redox-sensing transcriptional regulator
MTRSKPAAASDDWRLQGPCRDHDSELFFPLGQSAQAKADTRQAKAICAGCPLSEGCLGYALANDIRHGIWGGTTERERARLIGRLAPDEAGSSAALLEHAGAQLVSLAAQDLRPSEIADRLGSTTGAVTAALLKLKSKPTESGRTAGTGDTA